MKRAFILFAVAACSTYDTETPRDGGVEASAVSDAGDVVDAGDAATTAPPDPAQVRLVQQTDVAVGPDVATASFKAPLLQGSTIIAVGFWYNNLDAQITSSCVTSKFLAGPSPAKGYRLQIFYAENIPGGPCAVKLQTVTAGPIPFGVVAFEYAGLAKINSLVDAHSNVAVGTAPGPIGPLLMTAEEGGLGFAVFANRETGPITLLPPLQELASTSTGIRIAVGSHIAGSDGQLPAAARGVAQTAEWIAVGASFRRMR